MKIWRLAFVMLAALSLASCRQSAQKAEAEQQADSTEAVTNADTLQLHRLCQGYARNLHQQQEDAEIEELSSGMYILEYFQGNSKVKTSKLLK